MVCIKASSGSGTAFVDVEVIKVLSQEGCPDAEMSTRTVPSIPRTSERGAARITQATLWSSMAFQELPSLTG